MGLKCVARERERERRGGFPLVGDNEEETNR
jgi:hypothetical protein